jgi:predicted dehydrogenase
VKFLVVGLGSMGKRRVRNLHALDHKQIAGIDTRADRRAEAKAQYGIALYERLDTALDGFGPDAVIISVPPQHHMDIAERVVSAGLPCFIEASVVEPDRILALARRTREHGPVVAPSCTMRYFPGPRLVKRLLREGKIGKPLNLNYQTGQYLPDWHPWENINDFYVSKRETGGGREIVPFELTWLNDIFGDPEPLACVKRKLTDLDADIDDLYHCLLSFPGNVLANITVEVVSRPIATRELRVLGSEGILVFSADENCVRYANTATKDEWVRIPLERGHAEAGYINPEEPYISEMSDFIAAAQAGDASKFPNTLEADWRVLQVLEQLDSQSTAHSQ